MNVNLLTQTLHTIEKVFVPGKQPFITRRQSKIVFDIALVKLGETYHYNFSSINDKVTNGMF